MLCRLICLDGRWAGGLTGFSVQVDFPASGGLKF
jgi:hypothetical protein